MVWEENSRICLHMQLIAILSRIGVKFIKTSKKDYTQVSVKRNKATLQLCLVALLVIVENLLIIR